MKRRVLRGVSNAFQEASTLRSAGTKAAGKQNSGRLRPMSEMPGPKGLPVVGSLWDYSKKDGFRFNKMFLVSKSSSVRSNAHARYFYVFVTSHTGDAGAGA